jgi:hypothetical protein
MISSKRWLMCRVWNFGAVLLSVRVAASAMAMSFLPNADNGSRPDRFHQS